MIYLDSLRWPLLLFGAGLICLTTTGCDNTNSKGDNSDLPPVEVDELPPMTMVFDHPTAGPHVGSLIELGKEDYHGELLHDHGAGTVTIYILDGAAADLVPISDPKILINLSSTEDHQFELSARATKSDPAGKASRFVSSDPELNELIDESEAEAWLVLNIAGRSYRGKIGAHHGHGHDHDHAH